MYEQIFTNCALKIRIQTMTMHASKRVSFHVISHSMRMAQKLYIDEYFSAAEIRS